MPNSVVFALAVSLAVGLFFVAGCDDASQDINVLSPTVPSVKMPRDIPAVDPQPTPVSTGPPEPSESGPWPVVDAEDTSYEFGKMSVGTELEHVFQIGNSGEADLILEAGEPTCKCTAFELSSTIVKPGEVVDLRIRWQGKFKDAKFQHGGPVHTNDPKRTTIRYAVMGIVAANLEVLPEETWSVGKVSATDEGTMEGIVLSRVHETFSITDVQCDSPFVTAEVVPASAAQLATHQAASGYRVRVTVDPEMPPGVLEANLTLTVDCEKGPVSVTITAHKTGPIRILPLPGVTWSESSNALRLGQFSSRQGREASLMLLAEEPDGAEPLQFTSTKTVPAYLSVELERIGSVSNGKARYKMKIRVPPGIPRSERTTEHPGLIDIKTNHPSGQSLQLKLTYKALY